MQRKYNSIGWHKNMKDKEILCQYRLKQAEETLRDAEEMIKGNFSSRSILNRAYYSMYYAILALFLKIGIGIKTSKHLAIISMYDLEFIKTGKIDKHDSEILHRAFDDKQEADYKELIEFPMEKAIEHVEKAKEFLAQIKNFIK